MQTVGDQLYERAQVRATVTVTAGVVQVLTSFYRRTCIRFCLRVAVWVTSSFELRIKKLIQILKPMQSELIVNPLSVVGINEQ